MVKSLIMRKAAIVLLIFSASLISAAAYNWHGTTYPNPLQARELELLDTKAAGALRWTRPVLVFFGYAFCTDVCPTNLADTRSVFAELGQDAERGQRRF
jgi:cytochrome oxidase Cu insertion factor (SCO1/SenC/PrrC family)